MEKINANKTNISSRFCLWRKSEVIDDILDKIKIRKDVKYEYRTGSYADPGYLYGQSYIFEIRNGKITLTNVRLEKKKYELITNKLPINLYNWYFII